MSALPALPAPAPVGLVLTPHPMTCQGQQVLDAQAAALVPGETLASFLQRHGVVAGQQWLVAIGGVDVPEAHWHLVRPKHGHLVEARRVPQKSVLRLVATFALAYFTFGGGGLAGGGFLGMTKAAGYLAAGAAYMAGSVVINKLLGPKPLKPREIPTVSPTYSLSGGRNQARAWEPMGLVLGEPYCVPDLAAQPYTFFSGGEQFLWQLFHCGLNCASISAVRIGQTAIEQYQGVTLSYAGFASGNTGLPALGTSVDSIAGALLDAPASPGAWVTRTSSVETMQLAVDIEGSVFAVGSDGSYANLQVEIEIEYRLVGSGTWLKFANSDPYTVTHPAVYTSDYSDHGGNWTLLSAAWDEVVTPTTIKINNASPKPVRLTYQRTVSPGQYEVRARKVSANVATSSAQNQISWSTLKSFQVDNGNYAGQARLGVQIQASGQLSGALEEVNLQAVAKPMPYWNGSAWVVATSRANGLSNPGALILLLARGIYDEGGRLVAGLGWADAQIDIDGLKLFMVRCAAKGFTFDYFLQETVAIGDLLESIAAAGMGAISFHPGTLSVVWFSETDPVESVLNMGTFKARSFSVNYDTQATAEEIEFQYFDRDRGNAWRPVRVLAPGVTVPASTGRQQLVGVTTATHAAVLARFSMAQNIYQRKTVSCEVDLEHMTFRRGTVMAISHDITQWGYGGRVKAAVNVSGTVTLTLDDLVPESSPSGGATRYLGLRLAGENQYRVFGCSLVHRNLLNFSQQFDNAAWTKENSAAVTAGFVAPDGSLTAFRGLFATATLARLWQMATGAAGLTATMSIWLKSNTGVSQSVSLHLREAGFGATYAAASVTVTNTWQRFGVSAAIPGGSGGVMAMVYHASTGGPTWDVLMWGAQLEAAASAGEYQARPGPSRQVVLSSSWPGGVPVPGDSAANPAMDTVWIYDFKATPGQKMRVAEIVPEGNMEGARLALVPESAEFWEYVWNGAYTPPPNNSLLQSAPVVTALVVKEWLRRQGTGYYTELTAAFEVAGAYERAELWGAVGGGALRLLGSTRGLSVQWQGGLSETWSLELRAYSAIHAAAPYALAYVVAGLAEPPPPFDFFLVRVQPDGTRQFNFGYASQERQPVDWLGAEIRYVSGYVASPDWDTMAQLQDETTYYTSSPAELNAPPAGTVTFACKSRDTSGNLSTLLQQTITLPDRRMGSVLIEIEEHTSGWAGVLTACQVIEGVLVANDATTWATLPTTWDAWTRWTMAPASPISYVTPARDLGVEVSGQISSEADADGVVLVELATSADGSSWSSWGAIGAPFVGRYIKLRLTVTAGGGHPVPVVRAWTYQVNAPIKTEYLNDIDVSALTGSHRIGTGDVRAPMLGSYALLLQAEATIEDASAGEWTVQRIDKSLVLGPRFQFKLGGVLTDPASVDFYLRGF